MTLEHLRQFVTHMTDRGAPDTTDIHAETDSDGVIVHLSARNILPGWEHATYPTKVTFPAQV